jgi:RNA polymerase sigma-70 factor (ECF subfamily)
VVSAERQAVLADVLGTAAPDLLRYLERRLPADDAADALGEVLLVAWRRIDDLPATGDEARLWLFGIARNTVLSARRARSRRIGLAQQLDREPAARNVPGADRGLDVRDALDRLEPDLAELVRLVHWDGFPLADAARLLGEPASTVRSRYGRARALLRSALAEGAAPPVHSTAGPAPAVDDPGTRSRGAGEVRALRPG